MQLKLNRESAICVGVNVSIFRLRGSNVTEWSTAAIAVELLLDRLLNAPPDVFWSSLVYSENLQTILDSIADFYIRVGFFNEIAAYMSEQTVEKLYSNIYRKYSLVSLRILANMPNEGMSQTEYANLIYSRKVVMVQLLIKLCCVYGMTNREVFASLIANVFCVQPNFNRDLQDFVHTALQFLEQTKRCLADLATSVENCRGAPPSDAASQVVCLLKILDNSANILLSLASFVELIRPSLDASCWHSMLNNLAPFIDHATQVLTDRLLARLAMSTRQNAGNLLDFLAFKRTMVIQSAFHLFQKLYQSESLADKDRFFVLYDALVCKEFALRFDDSVGVHDEYVKFLKSGICTDEHIKTAIKLVDDAYEERAARIKTSLAQKCILRKIRHPKDAELTAMIQSLEDLLPDYSQQQFHLCLIYYGYDVERTINALMEKQEMPLDLRILLRKKDTFEDAQANTVVRIPRFADKPSYYDYECLETFESNKENCGVERRPVTAFNILPTTMASGSGGNAPLTTSLPQKNPQTAKLATLVSKYGGMFDLSSVSTVIESIDKARKTNATDDEVFIGDQPLIKHDPQRRKLMANTSAMTAEEKSAVRMTYDRYKYEMSDDDDEDGRHDLEARYAASVGQTGRFNRSQPTRDMENGDVNEPDDSGQLTEVITRQNTQIQLNAKAQKLSPTVAGSSKACLRYLANEDEDDYDDTYDDPDLFAKGEQDEEDIEETVNKPTSSTLAVGGPKKEAGKWQASGLTGRNDAARFAGRVSGNATQRPKQAYVPEFAKPRGANNRDATAAAANRNRDTSSPLFSSDGNETAATPAAMRAPPGFGSAAQQRGGQQRGKAPANRGGGGHAPTARNNRVNSNNPNNEVGGTSAFTTTTTSTTSYTGGHARQNKERHKNRAKQRGADRKMRGGMF